MHRSAIPLIGILASTLAGPVQAQSTNCQWFGAVWTCNQSPTPQQSKNPFGGLNNPSAAGDSAMEGFYRGQQMRQEAERARAERQRIEAERDYYRAQSRPPALAQPPARAIDPQTEFVASLEERQQMGAMVKAGKCEDAINRALELGDIQLATNIKQFCATNR